MPSPRGPGHHAGEHGPGEIDVARHCSRLLERERTWTNRKSASCFHAGSVPAWLTRHAERLGLASAGRRIGGLRDHGPYRQSSDRRPCLGTIAIHEEELVDPVCRAVSRSRGSRACCGRARSDTRSSVRPSTPPRARQQCSTPSPGRCDCRVSRRRRDRGSSHRSGDARASVRARGRLDLADDAELVGRHDPTVHDRPPQQSSSWAATPPRLRRSPTRSARVLVPGTMVSWQTSRLVLSNCSIFTIRAPRWCFRRCGTHGRPTRSSPPDFPR